MNTTGLSIAETDMIISVFKQISAIEHVVLFGSRAKGTARNNSDIDLAIYGINDPLVIEQIAFSLDELPLPYKFDVLAMAAINNPALLEHIKRVGLVMYERCDT